jgi:hypothetical protein
MQVNATHINPTNLKDFSLSNRLKTLKTNKYEFDKIKDLVINVSHLMENVDTIKYDYNKKLITYITKDRLEEIWIRPSVPYNKYCHKTKFVFRLEASLGYFLSKLPAVYFEIPELIHEFLALDKDYLEYIITYALRTNCEPNINSYIESYNSVIFSIRDRSLAYAKIINISHLNYANIEYVALYLDQFFFLTNSNDLVPIRFSDRSDILTDTFSKETIDILEYIVQYIDLQVVRHVELSDELSFDALLTLTDKNKLSIILSSDTLINTLDEYNALVEYLNTEDLYLNAPVLSKVDIYEWYRNYSYGSINDIFNNRLESITTKLRTKKIDLSNINNIQEILTELVNDENSWYKSLELQGNTLKIVLKDPIFMESVIRNNRIYTEVEAGTVFLTKPITAFRLEFLSTNKFPDVIAYEDENFSKPAHHPNISFSGGVCLGEIMSLQRTDDINRSTKLDIFSIGDLFQMLRMANLNSPYRGSREDVFINGNEVIYSSDYASGIWNIDGLICINGDTND